MRLLHSLPRRFLSSRAVWTLALVAAASAFTAFGILGVGRYGGFQASHADLPFYYVAGQCWLQGLSPYDLESLLRTGEDIGGLNEGGFAYPPQSASLCLPLALFPVTGAKILIWILGTVSTLALAGLCGGPLFQSRAESISQRAPEARWLIAAVIIGNPFTAHVLWLGQTTLLVAAAMAGAWACASRNKWLIGGLLLSVATIKPHLSLLPILWLVLERRWKLLSVGAAGALILSLPAVLVSGPFGAFWEWFAAVGRYEGQAFHQPGYRHVFGLRSLLAAGGIHVPWLLPMGLAATATLWWFRSKVHPSDVLGLLLATSILFVYAHDPDLVMTLPLVPAFWRHLRGRDVAAWTAVLLMFVMFFPQRLLRGLESDVLLHFRVPVFLGLTLWLLVLSLRENRAKESASLKERPSDPPQDRALNRS